MAARTISFVGKKTSAFINYLSALTKHTDEDKLVKMSANGTVVACTTENDEFIGIVRVIDQDDKLASVQEDGYVTFPYDTNHAPSIGYNCLQAGGTDGDPAYTSATCVKKIAAAVGTPFRRVVWVDTVNKLVTFRLDQG
jgi:hypothetical protein